MAAIQLRDVRRVFPDGTAALDGVDLAIADGEFLGIIGPSGSGKSTLVNAVAGLEPIQAGAITIAGRNVTELHYRHRGIARLGRDEDLELVLSVAEELIVPPDFRRLPAIAQTGRTGRGYRPSRRDLQRSLAKRSAALLLDQPLQVMDPATRSHLVRQLHAFHQASGMTILMGTNCHRAVLTIADRLALLQRGRIAQVGTPEDLLRRPASAYVAANVGDHAVSTVPATVDDDAGIGWLGFGDQRLRFPGGLPGPLRGRASRSVLLGARPNQVRLSQAEDPADQRLSVRVSQVTHIGSHLAVDLEVPGGHLRAHLDPAASVAPGTRVEVTLDVRGLVAFDDASGMAIWHGRHHRVT